MRFSIKHELKGRIRIHFNKNRFTTAQADMILYYVYDIAGVTRVKVYDRTADVVIEYNCEKRDILHALNSFRFDDEEIKSLVPETTNRKLNNYYKEKLFDKFIFRLVVGTFCPVVVKAAFVGAKSLYYLGKGIKALSRKSLKLRELRASNDNAERYELDADIINATTVGISLLKRDFHTAFSTMFLLDINKMLRDWTHKKIIDEAANKIDLNVDKVWCMIDGSVVLVPIADIKKGDLITIHMGNTIPVDGYVYSGEAMVNESNLIGESVAIRKELHSYVYAGSMVEEGEIAIRVKRVAKKSRYEKMLEDLNEFRFDKTVDNNLDLDVGLIGDIAPYSLIGTLLTYGLTGNFLQTFSTLMLNLSCSLRFAAPMALLSAMEKCDINKINVKNGIFLEKITKADTIVFDKMGTLTQANPVITNIITFDKYERDEILRLAAAIEEHFPHAIANAIVKQYESENLYEDKIRVKVEELNPEGIISYVNNKRIIIGNRKFVLESKECIISDDENSKVDCIKNYDSKDTTFIYMSISGRLAAVILVVDHLRAGIAELFSKLRANGISRIVMMTGDSERTAKDIAKRIGVSEYLSDMTPKAKVKWIENQKKLGNKIIMTGYGMGDAPALLTADVGIAFDEGAKINKEVADIIISSKNLEQLVLLKQISNEISSNSHDNYKKLLPPTVIANTCLSKKIN